MTSCVIELNDNEIRVGLGGDIILRSPGYALIDGERIELGEAAAKQARLNPRAVHNRYWKNLNQDPLQYPSSRARHNADLAFAQLLAIHEKAGKPVEAIFAVPATYSKEQLALLLGLVDASPFKAVGLVDSAVAATSPVAGKGNYVHIDIHLHQTILTRVNVDDQVRRSSVQIIDGAGMLSIFDATAHLIADLFIKESRFDPQHHPETEQALYDQIPACLNSLLTNSEVALEIQYHQTQHQAKLPADLLKNTLQVQYHKIVSAINPTDFCLLSYQIAQLPGLITLLSDYEVLPALAIFQACDTHESSIRSTGSALNYVTSLPATSEPLITEIAKPIIAAKIATAQNKPGITHILHEHNAYPLNEDHVYLSATGVINKGDLNSSHCSIKLNNGNFSLQPEGELTVFLNGEQLKQAVQVAAGDIISFVGSNTEYTFIHVSD
ncbi:MAG: hypothetical protein ACI9SC_000083 [Gammaproteobacteria bacterium]|jgi:hypothetical protein